MPYTENRQYAHFKMSVIEDATVTEMQNSNKSAVLQLQFVSKCKTEKSLVFIYTHIFSF